MPVNKHKNNYEVHASEMRNETAPRVFAFFCENFPDRQLFPEGLLSWFFTALAARRLRLSARLIFTQLFFNMYKNLFWPSSMHGSSPPRA
jgi:hypothetical protein